MADFFTDMEDPQKREEYEHFVEQQSVIYQNRKIESMLREWEEEQAWDAWASEQEDERRNGSDG